MSITIDIDEQLLADLGREEIERALRETVERLERRNLARPVAEDLPDTDSTNFPDYQADRAQVWEMHGHQVAAKKRRLGLLQGIGQVSFAANFNVTEAEFLAL